MNRRVSFSCSSGVPGLRLIPNATFIRCPPSYPIAERVGREGHRALLDDRVGRRHQARDLDLLPIDHGRDLRGDLVLPVVALIDEVVESLALLLVLEPADPDVDALVFLADEAAEDHHAHLDLERDDLLLHAPDPLVTLPRTDVVLPQLEEHAGLPGLGPTRSGPAPKGYTTARDLRSVYDPVPVTRNLVALSPPTLPDTPPIEYVQVAAAAGYDAVGLRLARSPLFPFHPVVGNAALIRELKVVLASSGLSVLDILSFYLQPATDLDSFAPALALSAEIRRRY